VTVTRPYTLFIMQLSIQAQTKAYPGSTKTPFIFRLVLAKDEEREFSFWLSWYHLLSLLPCDSNLCEYCCTRPDHGGFRLRSTLASRRFLLAASGSFSRLWHAGFPATTRSLDATGDRYSSLQRFGYAVVYLITNKANIGQYIHKSNKNALHLSLCFSEGRRA
jgi:hypothetical protein